MILGFFIVKPIPPPSSDGSSESGDTSEYIGPVNGELYHSLPVEDSEFLTTEPNHKPTPLTRDTSRTRLFSRDREGASSQRYPPRGSSAHSAPGLGVDLHGKSMFKTIDFWLLFIPMFLCE
jgi:hypothetical protein